MIDKKLKEESVMDFINENVTRKIDCLGRVSVPKGIRQRLGFGDNEELQVATMRFDGIEWVCFGKKKEDNKEKYMIVAEMLRELGVEVPKEVAEKIE